MQIAERWRPYMKTNFSFRSNKKFNPSAELSERLHHEKDFYTVEV